MEAATDERGERERMRLDKRVSSSFIPSTARQGLETPSIEASSD